jgi:tripartite-type tricarboxylate transporter receptor subunit TctC
MPDFHSHRKPSLLTAGKVGRRDTLRSLAAVGLASMGLPQLAFAQASSADWPRRPIQIMIGFPPGGTNDLAARALAPSLQVALGVPVTVTNVPGAGGIIALQKLMQAPPDGYTLLYTPSPTLLARPYQMSLALTHRDVSPVANVAMAVPTISVKSDHRWKTFKDFQAEALAHPGKIAYASPGVGGLPHIAMENTAAQLGLKLNHVPYKGATDAVLAAISGQLDIVVGDLARPDIRPLAVVADERVPFWPNVPGMRELGVATTLVPRFSIVGPKGLPDAIAQRFGSALRLAMNEAPFKRLLIDNRMAESFLTPAETRAIWDREEPAYRRLIDQLDLKGK